MFFLYLIFALIFFMIEDFSVPKFKLLLVGDGGVGKTTFVRRHRTGEFEKKHIPTIGLDVLPLTFHTNLGPICFNVWDTAGQEKFKDIRNAYFVGADCAIVMFDVSDKITWKNVPFWCREIYSVNKIPICICGNKIDRGFERKVKPSAPIKFVKKKKCIVEYFDISAKTNYNFEKPFLYLSKLMLKSPDVTFVEIPDLLPPQFVMPKETLQQIENDLKNAQNIELEDDQDDDV